MVLREWDSKRLGTLGVLSI